MYFDFDCNFLSIFSLTVMATTPARGSGGSSGKRHGSAEKPYTVPHTRIQDESNLAKLYDLSKSLGKGTFGIVHLATHIESNTTWACKTVSKEKAGSANIMLLEREVSILKRVQHEHIIQLKEVLETSKKMYLIMECCDGGELTKLLKKKSKFTELETRIIMLRLADAIAYLHKNDTVHRDLKLENILLARNVQDAKDEFYIKITDFGLSVQKGGSSHEDMMIDQCGTPIYMAPEILRNNTYSEKCDIWAMGVIMFLLLSGTAPFNAGHQDELLTVVQESDLSREIERAGLQHVSDKARDCMKGMLNTDPAYRLTASEVLDHPWFNEKPLSDVTQRPRNVLELMKEFQNESATEKKSDKKDCKTSSQTKHKLPTRGGNHAMQTTKLQHPTRRALSASQLAPRTSTKH